MPPETDVFIWVSRIPLSNWKLSQNKACHMANTWKVVGPELGPSVFWYSTGFKEVPCVPTGNPRKASEGSLEGGGQSEQDILRVEAQVPWEVGQGVLGPGSWAGQPEK